MKSNSPDANISLFQNITNWVKNTPERAINDAFEAAVSIKRIEEENFNGNKIANDGTFGQSVFSVFAIQLEKYLEYINSRLKFYKFSAKLTDLQTRSDLPTANNAIAKLTINQQTSDPVGRGQLSANQLAGNSRRFSLYQKLAFIDYTLERYNKASDRIIDITADTSGNATAGLSKDSPESQEDEKFQLFKNEKPKKYRQTRQPLTPIEKSILPGSFLKAFDRVKRNLSDSYTEYERDIVEELRQSRQRINKALRYIILLVIAVLAVQIFSKNLIFSPMIDSFVDNKAMSVRFSPAIEERAFTELRIAKERIEFDFMIKSIMLEQSESQNLQESAPASKEQAAKDGEGRNVNPAEEITKEQRQEGRSPEESLEALIREESLSILRKYNAESLDGVKNLLADITAAFIFYLFLLSGRQELITIKEFLDEFLYSLNDNAKAFLIIISTDTFVGFHSSEGWDALLTVIFQHFGLPENKILAQSFISTVPVFLDGLFKFWIFQYLTQASPATATIYREMNE